MIGVGALPNAAKLEAEARREEKKREDREARVERVKTAWRNCGQSSMPDPTSPYFVLVDALNDLIAEDSDVSNRG